jgi:hypothetical protein
LGFARMIEGQDWATADPLGLGGLLVDAARVAQLMRFGAAKVGYLLEKLLADALRGLAHYSRQDDLSQPASHRLAFRELGLAIGLSAIEVLEGKTETEQRPFVHDAAVHDRIEALRSYLPLGSAIEAFWLDRDHRDTRNWSEHRDINEVMLATSLIPTGFLVMGVAVAP